MNEWDEAREGGCTKRANEGGGKQKEVHRMNRIVEGWTNDCCF